MEQKNIVATIYLKNGQAVRGRNDFNPVNDVITLARFYNDSGIDKLLIFDLSDEDEEHEKNLHVIKMINRNVELKVCAGGNINRLEDIKKFIYAGCLQVLINGAKQSGMEIAQEACRRFGKERILVSVANVDFLFKHQEELAENFHELLVLNTDVLDAIENITDLPYLVNFDFFDYENIVEVLKRRNTRGIAGGFINEPQMNIMELKSRLSADGIKMDHFEPALGWNDLKKNSDGMVPVVVQDYRTDEVLMVAYMNEEAFDATLHTGRMTYYSRSRQTLWTKGMTSGHVQYVKSLTADCDFDTIIGKGIADRRSLPHRQSDLLHEIVKKEYMEKNPLKVLEDVYDIILDRRAHPKEGSYTNYLFDKGIDKILKKIGEEATEIVIAAKNPDSEESNMKFLISCIT